jgi:3-oxoacyl-[acyl-carrier-protein] synthase-1
MTRVVITGSGALCAAGASPAEIVDTLLEGRSAVGPIERWDTTGWPRRVAAEIRDLQPNKLVPDRKLHKLIRRSDLFGLYAGAQAIESSGLVAWRDALDEAAAAAASDDIGVYVGSGGGTYESQYDFFPLLDVVGDDLPAFGRELSSNVNPMWLLRTLPNNVLCHIGIRFGLKGPNACVTTHSASGLLAMVEAFAAVRDGEAGRAVAIGHDAALEPQTVLYYHQVGVLAEHTVRPFDARRDGSAFGEGAASLVLETETNALARGATALGEVLGGGSATEGDSAFGVLASGDGPARAMRAALDDAGVAAADIGMIVGHANGTRQSDASEARAILDVFGASPPPVTGFKWCIGHLIAASGSIEAVLALESLRRGVVPGIATLETIDPAFADLPVSAQHRAPRSPLALVLSRGFGGTNAALIVKAVLDQR